MKKFIARPALIALGILLIPFAAMQFTDQVRWDVVDFTVMGGLVFGTGLAYELITRNMVVVERKIITAMMLTILLVLVWVQLAVGIWD